MKAVIQAGGKGTRISSVTQDEIPKPMLMVGGAPILEHQIECLKKSNIDEIIIIIGYLGEKIKSYFGSGEKHGIKISYIEESPENPLGTAGSLFYLKEKIKEDFILIFGDVFLSVDFNKIINFHKENQSDATLLTHPNSHPYDSDLVLVDKNNKVIKFDSKNNIRDYDYKNLVNSGIYIFSTKIFEYILEPKKVGLEHGVIAKMLEFGDKIYSYKSTEYVKDMGTPERYESVNRDFEKGICVNRNLENKQKCIFLDRDGTINELVGFLNKKEQLKLLKNAAKAIKLINNSDYLCIVITNQPVIARGECTFKEMEEINKRLETLLGNEGAYIDGLYFCPHHPDKGFKGEVPELKKKCDCRKPEIGMVLKAAADFNIDIKKSVMIGDSTLDIKLAENANMKSVLVMTGEKGNDNKYNITPTDVAQDIYEAVQKCLKMNI